MIDMEPDASAKEGTVKWLREKMSKEPDFKGEKSRLEHMIESRGHLCWFVPKYHCELNPIELHWDRLKFYVRNNSNGSIQYLSQSLIFDSLSPRVSIEHQAGGLPPYLVQEYSRKWREFLKAYDENKDDGCAVVENARTVYKSHRRVELDSTGQMKYRAPQVVVHLE